jgi:CheY-like chemotaxis protein
MKEVEQALRILIVENEPSIVTIIEEIVRDAGWQIVGPAMTFQEAVTLAATADCDGAVLDIHLDEGITSLPAAEILRDRGIPFFFATGLGAPGQRPGFVDVPVLMKPFRYGSFVGAVNKYLLGRQQA